MTSSSAQLCAAALAGSAVQSGAPVGLVLKSGVWPAKCLSRWQLSCLGRARPAVWAVGQLSGRACPGWLAAQHADMPSGLVLSMQINVTC